MGVCYTSPMLTAPNHSDRCACCGDLIDPRNYVFVRGMFWCLPCDEVDTRIPATDGFYSEP